MSHHGLTRREFITRMTAATALAAGSGALGWLFHNRRLVPSAGHAITIPSFAMAGTGSLMAVAHGTDSAKAVAAALQELGGISRFIKPGDRVLLKPNCAFDRPAHLGATTSPDVLAEVVRQCRAAGAGDIRVIDNPINDAAGCFAKSGLTKAVEAAGGRIWLPEPGLFSTVKIGPLCIPEWEALGAPLKWATKIIGLPTVKSHNLSGASLTMKNWYGLLGGPRNRLHQSIHEVIVDLGCFITPTLVVMDGSRLLKRNGPTGGNPDDVEPGNVIAAGTDQVALDTFGATLLDRNPDEIAYLAKAEQQGLGKRDWKSLATFREITL